MSLYCLWLIVSSHYITIENVLFLAPKMEGDRDAYRTAEKVTDAGPGAMPPVRAGFGRGAPPPQ